MSVEEYLEFEKNSPVRHECVGGHVYAMPGASRRHNRISGNIFRRVREAADDTPCRVYVSDMKVLTPDSLAYYPDVMVACGPEPEDEYLEDAPCLIVEVLSQDTEATDRREKLLAYCKLKSLRACLIVARDEASVERRFRDERGEWRTEISTGGDIPVPCPPGAGLSLAAVYESL